MRHVTSVAAGGVLSPSGLAADIRDADDERLRNGGRPWFTDHQGRENAGYGGLLAWPTVIHRGWFVTQEGMGGDELRGKRMAWMAFEGRHDETTAQPLVLMVDDAANPTPFFSEELTVEDAATVPVCHGVDVADSDASAAPALADAVRRMVARPDTPTAAVNLYEDQDVVTEVPGRPGTST